MNYKVLAKMGLRLIALYYFVTYCSFTVTFIMNLLGMKGKTDPATFAYSMPMLFMIAAGVLLWIFAGKIADFLVGEAKEEETSGAIDYDKILSIGFCIAGVLVTAKAIPALFNDAYQLHLMADAGMKDGGGAYSNYVGQVISAGIQSIIGIGLLLGNKGIVNIIKKVRAVGVDEESK